MAVLVGVLKLGELLEGFVLGVALLDLNPTLSAAGPQACRRS